MNVTRPMRSHAMTTVIAAIVVLSMAVAGLAVPQAEAAGPPYSGPPTETTGPAFFGPAPNPFPYCENPTYFDPFPENVNPIGRIDVNADGSPNASVTTNNVTMTFELTAEGNPGTQYPGFFPAPDGEGDDTDQPKGVEMATGDEAVIRLSEPLFYTQWVFTDVDRANEGFFVTPLWSDTPGELAVFGGDANFDFDGTVNTEAIFNDTDTQGQDSEKIEGRVQVDLLGASTGISLVRDTGSGQSGFAVGGGCEPIGVAKEVTSGPTWNGSSFDVTYTIRVRNNLPSGATIAGDIDAALAAAASGVSTGTPQGIVMEQITLTDLLEDDAFETVTVVSNINTSGNVEVNPDYDGITNGDLLAAGETIPAESEEEFVLTVNYVPDGAEALGPDCTASYNLQNQATVGGLADGVVVGDLSDEGPDPDPGVDNGGGGVDDPTDVVFDCPPVLASSMDLVKTVLAGPAATCGDFAAGVTGDGPALDVSIGDTVTYCISVINTGDTDITNVVITDPQAPASFAADGDIGTLAAGAEVTVSFDLPITADSPDRNVASATGDDPAGGRLPPVTDPAIIALPDAAPGISLSKTVLAGADADCTTAVEGTDEFYVGITGDAITWCFVVTNTGDVPLTNVIFNDAPAGIVDLDLLATEASNVLAVGASLSFSEAGTIPETGVNNVASVSAQGADDNGDPLPGFDPVEDENTAAVNEAALTLSKTVVPGANGDCAVAGELTVVNAGSAVTYCFTVENTGGVAMRVEEVVDITLGVTIPLAPADQVLAPGSSVTVFYSTTAEADLVNVATTEGVPIDTTTGEPIPNAPTFNPEDPAAVETLEADLSIVKTGGVANVLVGNIIPFTLVVANAGPDDAVNVVVVDTLPTGLAHVSGPDTAGWTCSDSDDVLTCNKSTPLAPGESATLTYLAQVGPDAPLDQDMVNTATVSSDTPDPDLTNNEDTEITKRVPPRTPPDETLPIVVITNPPPTGVTPPAPPLALPPAVPAAPPLATTGVSSGWLAFTSAAMTAAGGVLLIGGRRRSEDHS